MAEPTKSPLSNPAMYNIETPTLVGVNPMGFTSDPEVVGRLEKYKEAQEGFLKGLENRFAQPNLFGVAAGFLKPQLGGFGASLGSAFGALSDWQEQQKAMLPTIAKQRAEIARADIMLEQAKKSAKPIEKAIARGEVPTAAETLESEAWAGGPKGASAAGQTISTAQQNQLVQLLQEGRSYTELISKLPKTFVDKYLPYLLSTTPGLKAPAGMPKIDAPVTEPIIKSETHEVGHIPGVPKSMTSNLPIGPQQAAQLQNISGMQEERDKLNSTLGQAASVSVPIFEASTNLYKAASNPDLAPAFAVFEKGDPLGAIGKILESGSLPRMFETMRSQIISARLGTDREKRAISDLQAMEGALAELKVQMNNGVINPTDFRTVAEGESIPGIRNTQDAFLRGAARIGSVALTKYETKAAFDRALKDPEFDIRTWASSPYFSSVQENAKKRTQALITNPASVDMPKFMQSGLEGSFKYEPKKTSDKSKVAPKTSDWQEEARRRGLIQ